MSFEIISTAAGFIQFTDLGVGPVALDLGFFQIRWYSLGYLVGIMLGYWMLLKLLARPGAPMSRAQADDIILYTTLGIILGGRIGYILFYQPSILQNPMDVLKLWEGGMSFHGGAIGIIFSLWLLARKHKLSVLRVCDYVACVVPFGLFFVRLANFVNDELWGRVTDVPWAVVFPNGGDLPRHPSQLYEAVLEGLLMAAILWPLFWKTNTRYRPGFLTGMAAIIYGTARFSIEFFREPDQQLQWLVETSGLSMGQWLTIPMILVGLFLVFTAGARKQRAEAMAGSNSVT